MQIPILFSLCLAVVASATSCAANPLGKRAGEVGTWTIKGIEAKGHGSDDMRPYEIQIQLYHNDDLVDGGPTIVKGIGFDSATSRTGLYTNQASDEHHLRKNPWVRADAVFEQGKLGLTFEIKGFGQRPEIQFEPLDLTFTSTGVTGGKWSAAEEAVLPLEGKPITKQERGQDPSARRGGKTGETGNKG